MLVWGWKSIWRKGRTEGEWNPRNVSVVSFYCVLRAEEASRGVPQGSGCASSASCARRVPREVHACAWCHLTPWWLQGRWRRCPPCTGRDEATCLGSHGPGWTPASRLTLPPWLGPRATPQRIWAKRILSPRHLRTAVLGGCPSLSPSTWPFCIFPHFSHPRNSLTNQCLTWVIHEAAWDFILM